MMQYAVPLIAALISSMFLTPFLIKISKRIGIMDMPGERKIHENPMPTSGGIAIFISFFFSLWASWFLGAWHLEGKEIYLFGLTFASILIILLGILDDLHGTTPWQKLAFQIPAAVILYFYGFNIPLITNPFGDSILLNHLNLPLTVIWMITIINAFNLIDGLDGLSTGMAIISSMTLFLISSACGEFVIALTCIIMVGACLGFLRYNFPPARIFLGDTGSMFLGLILGAVSLLERRKGITAITLMLPITAMSIPVIDTCLAFFRRIIGRKNPFTADNGHIHHRLLKLGLRKKDAVLLLYYISIYFALMGYVMSFLPKQKVFMMALIFGMTLFIGFKTLGFLEKRSQTIPDEKYIEGFAGEIPVETPMNLRFTKGDENTQRGFSSDRKGDSRGRIREDPVRI
ncbi:undecaprenyl/decaprenyl-phosphate alpha-N-acetylglucosaminyl 1-phosphate transferase [bacterium]|nr:undecaprenyl/decaprenyl-phosphate alpha-N-acetylglucosaminyl 1-phosphate transferase [bacterium]